MKITDVRSRVIEFPLHPPFYPAWNRGRAQTSLVLVIFEVHTDAGLVGLGAAHGGLEAAIAVDRFVTPSLLGQDPTLIERISPLLHDAEILGPPVYRPAPNRPGGTAGAGLRSAAGHGKMRNQGGAP